MANSSAKPSKPQKPDKIVFFISQAEGYRVAPISGVYGSLTPRSMVAASFFCDYAAMPDSVTHAINQDGTLGKEIARTGLADGPCVERRLECGIVVDAETARGIAKWLTDKANELDKIKKKVGETVP